MRSLRVLASFFVFTLPFAGCASSSSPGGSSNGGTTSQNAGMGGIVGSGGAPSDAGATDSGVAQCNGSGATGYNPYKYAYFGDLHLHTSYSLDAYSFGTRSDPENAYLFAKGQATVDVGSGSDAAAGPAITQSRPLDFLAITDHSEWLYVTRGCTLDVNSGYYDTSDCGLVRSSAVGSETSTFSDLSKFKSSLCATNSAPCIAEEKTAWQDLQAAAAAAYQPCQFTSLVAYEWTDSQQVIDESTDASAGVTNHRNVIFRTAQVPVAPLSATDYPDPPSLWKGLETACTAQAGCEVVTIPHNTNLSAGVSLVVWDPTPAGVALQEKYQIAAEIYQHKAASECFYSPADGFNDTDCQFELADKGKGVVNDGPNNFVRTALGTGMGYAAANPAQGNPLKLGIVGATDDHNGAPGNVDEAKFVGHLGRLDDIPLKRLTRNPDYGSGALTAAWAEQNTREAIFAAIKRRETFATSGPRLTVRFFQTSDATACGDPAFPKQIVDAQTALPMGSTIGKSALAGAQAPTFVVTAWPDPVPQQLGDGTTDVAGIAKVQIIKVHAQASNGQPVIVQDAPNAVSGIPAAGGCGTWIDNAFDPSEYAVYYVRVLQVPTWRWSHFSCAELKTNAPKTWQTQVPGCADGGGLDVTIQERAWTSPIWYEPG